MPVGGLVALDLKAIAGVRIGTSSAGISQTERDDITVFELSESTQVAAVFTTNKFCAAPVVIAKSHIDSSAPKYLLINSGNANAGLGDEGIVSAKQSCEGLAKLVQCDAVNVLPFSTGVIGEPLPVTKLLIGLASAIDNVDENNWPAAAKAIMTTDTSEKGCTRVINVSGVDVTITGIAKGSGMIRPDMATMLSYVATDMPIEKALLQNLLRKVTDLSFNSITVDGDTSTNDAVVLMATGAASVSTLESEDDPRYAAIKSALIDVFKYLSEAIVRDGEGATKLIKVQVEEAVSIKEAKEVAYTVAHSPLVKTAFFASDPNWGRILAAVGRSNISNLDSNKVSIHLNDVCIVEAGQRCFSYTEEKGQTMMSQDEIQVRISLGQGSCASTVLTCDLSYDYVKINAEYRS